MYIRRAQEKDIPKMIDLLQQVLQVHADIRPDLFIAGTTKYSIDQLKEILKDDDRPIYAAVNQRDEMIQKQFSEAKKSQDDAESLKSDYKKKLESAKTQADQIILDARARAEAEQEKALERTRQEADSMLEKAKADIASEQDKATKAAEAEIAKLAILAARKIVKTGEANDTGSSK